MNKIVSTREMLLQAQKYGYAVPAFNVHNLETFQVVVDTACELNSPVIVAGTPSTLENYAGIDYMVNMGEVAAQRHHTPIAIHLDHYEDVALIKKGIDFGFLSCMIDASHHSLQENMDIVSSVVAYAHRYDVSVEAELGKLCGIEDDLVVDQKDAIYTNPAEAADYVKGTEIDSLAVAIGTAHGLYKGEPKLDFERLKEIRDVVDIPLVLHGASDVPDEMVKRAIALGICKVNVSTDLKMPFSSALAAYLKENPEETDPRKYMIPAKAAMKKIVAHKIMVCGSNDRYKNK